MKPVLCYVFVFHEDERVKVDVAVEMDVWYSRLPNSGLQKAADAHSMRQYHLYFSIKGCLKKN
jgi:hypothetical protein